MKEEVKEEVKPETGKEVQAKTARYVVGEVPTQYAPIIHDTEAKENLEVLSALAKIMNDIEAIKKHIHG